MFAALQAQVARDDSGLVGALRAKPTSQRRLILLSALAALVLVEFGVHMRVAFHDVPVRVAVSLAVFGGLMVVMLLSSLRPMHQPALSPRAEALLVGGSVVAALGLSLWPTLHEHRSLADAARGATGCLTYGLAAAVPVYLLARMLDRGSSATGMIAALAAGLTANFLLMSHCRMQGADHMLFGHFGVIAILMIAYTVWSRLKASS
jgi:hypothetical protein